MSKLGRNLWSNYDHAVDNSYDCLDDVYTSYSYEKAQAFKYCERLRDKYHGKTLFITSHNTWQFSCAFECEAIDTKTSAIENGLVYITVNNNRFVTEDEKVYDLSRFVPVDGVTV